MGVTTRKPQAGSTLLVSQLTVLLPCLICFGYCYFCMDWGFITQCLIKILRLCRGREPQNTMLLYHVNRVNSRPESEERPSALLEHRNKNETSSMLESELVRSIPSRDIAYRQAPVLAQRPPASILPLWALSRGSVLITTSHTSLPGVLFIFRSPSTVAARLSLCVTFFSAQKKDDRKSFLSPSWIPLIARPPQHSLVAIPKGCVAHHAASTAYQARECSQGTS